MRNQTIYLSHKPYASGKIECFERPATMSIQEIVESIPDKPGWWDDHGAVIVDDTLWPRSCWDFRAEPGSYVYMTVHLGDAVKDFLVTVAAVLLAVVTAGLSAVLIPIVGAVGASLISAAVGIVGSIVIGLLFKPSVPGQPQLDSGLTPGSASISGNVLPPGGRVARCVGPRRVFPPVVALPFHEVIDDDEYSEAGFALAGPHSFADIRLGETLIADDSQDIQHEHRQGLYGDAPINLLTRQGFETIPQITLTKHARNEDTPNELANIDDPFSCLPSWHRVTSRKEPDEIWLTLAWREGLFDEELITDSRNHPIRFRFRQVGSSTWINCPEIHFRDKRAQLVRRTVRFIWGAAPAVLPTPPTGRGAVQAFVEVPVQDGTPVGIGGWQAHTHFDAGAGFTNYQNTALYSDRVIFYLDEGTFPKGTYEIEVIKGATYDPDNFVDSTYIYGGVNVFDFFGFHQTGGGNPRIPLAGISDYDNIHDDVIVQYCTSIWNETPFPRYGEDALFAIRVKNRAVNEFSAVANGLVPDWDGAEWSGLVETSNPAPHLQDILTGNLNADPIPSDVIDHAALVAWRSFCASSSLTVHAIAESASVDDAIALCVSAGHAIIRSSDTWGVAYEHDRTAESPVQLFSHRNSNNFQWSLAWDRIPDAVLVSYLDPLNHEQQVLVLDEGVTTPKRLMQSKYAWIDTEAQAIEQGQLDLALARLRSVFYQIDVPAEGFVCQRGDLVALQHDSLSEHVSSARIIDLVKSGNDITGLILDSEIHADGNTLFFNQVADVNDVENVTHLGLSYGMAIRKSDGSIILKELSSSAPTKEPEFATPFADPGDIEFGNVVVTGPLASEYQRKIVFGISMKNELAMTLTLVDEAAELYA